jgi:hypothetical protein
LYFRQINDFPLLSHLTRKHTHTHTETREDEKNPTE